MRNKHGHVTFRKVYKFPGCWTPPEYGWMDLDIANLYITSFDLAIPQTENLLIGLTTLFYVWDEKYHDNKGNHSFVKADSEYDPNPALTRILNKAKRHL